MNRSRLVVTVASVAWAITLLLPPERVEADTPVVQGWWTVRNLSIETPIPTLIPDVTIPSDDIPDGGSDVAGTEAQPVGILALRYEFTAGSTLGTLQLRTAEDVPATPGTEIVACPLSGDGTFDSTPGGGPIREAPASDCSRRAEGSFDEAAGTWSFDVADLAAEEHLSVAIVPVAGRAVFERARSESLRVEPPDLPSTPATDRAVPPARPRPIPPLPPATTPVGTVPSPAAPTTVAPPPSPAPGRTALVRYVAPAEPVGSTVVATLSVLVAAGAMWRRGRTQLLAVNRDQPAG